MSQSNFNALLRRVRKLGKAVHAQWVLLYFLSMTNSAISSKLLFPHTHATQGGKDHEKGVGSKTELYMLHLTNLWR